MNTTVAPLDGSARPPPHSASYDAIDAYIEQQMRRLHIPGVSLAIVEGDQIVHLRGFGKARPNGETPTPQTPWLGESVTANTVPSAFLNASIRRTRPVTPLESVQVAPPSVDRWISLDHACAWLFRSVRGGPSRTTT